MMLALPDCALTPIDRICANLSGIAPQVGTGILALAAAVHAGPCAKRAGTDDGRAVRHLKPERRIRRMRQAGEPGERFGWNKFSLAPELHAADNGGEVYVAAAFAGAEQRALNLNGAGQNRGPGIGDSEAAICVPMKSEFDVGISRGSSRQ